MWTNCVVLGPGDFDLNADSCFVPPSGSLPLLRTHPHQIIIQPAIQRIPDDVLKIVHMSIVLLVLREEIVDSISLLHYNSSKLPSYDMTNVVISFVSSVHAIPVHYSSRPACSS